MIYFCFLFAWRIMLQISIGIFVVKIDYILFVFIVIQVRRFSLQDPKLSFSPAKVICLKLFSAKAYISVIIFNNDRITS